MTASVTLNGDLVCVGYDVALIIAANKVNLNLGGHTIWGPGPLSFNGSGGISVTDSTLVDGGGNTAKGNDYSPGNPPVQCEGVVCA